MPLVTGVKSYGMYKYRRNLITPLVRGIQITALVFRLITRIRFQCFCKTDHFSPFSSVLLLLLLFFWGGRGTR